jgi:hypothetical protein
MLLKTALLVLALPPLVAAVLVLILRGFRGRGNAEDRPWPMVLGLGAGYLAGNLAIGWPPFPPLEVTDRIPFLAVAATVLGLLESAWPLAARVRWGDRLILVALTLGVILGPILAATAGTRAGILWLAGVGAVAVLSWANLEVLAGRPGTAGLFGSLVVTAAGAGAVLVASSSAVLGQLGVVLAAALTGAGLASWRMGRGLPSPGIVPVVATVLTALVVDGHVYANTPTSSALLLAAAPTAAWLGAVKPVRGLAPWKVSLLAAIVTVVPVGLALWRAMAESPANEY